MKKIIETNKKKAKPITISVVDNLTVDKLQESWIKLYPVIEHWQSDMKFFQDELRFLHMLIDKYLIGLIKEKNVAKTRVLAKKLYGMEPRRKKLDEQSETHLHHLQELIKNPFSYDVHVFNKEHIEIEKLILEFINEFRALKSEAFRIFDQVISEDAKKRIL